MAKLTPMLDEKYMHTDGTYPIVIRVTNKNQTRYKAIGYSVLPNQFKRGTEKWVSKHPDSVLLNALIEEARALMASKMIRLQLEKREFNFDVVMSDTPISEGVDIKPKYTLGDILDKIADRHFKNDQIGQYYKQRSLKNQVTECLGLDKPLNDFCLEDVQGIVDCFKNVHRNKPNTVSRKLRYLSTAYSTAQIHWPKDIDPGNPFKLVKVKREKVKKIKLNKKQLQALEDLPLHGMFDLARDMYLFAVYAQGMRFGNVSTIKKEAIDVAYGNMAYRMNKGRENRDIELHPLLVRIIDKYWNSGGPYLFPLLKKECTTKKELYYGLDEANYNINFYLKKIGDLLVVKGSMTFHTSRHTFAQLLKKAGILPFLVQGAMGHEEFGTTEVYLEDLDDDDINAAVVPVFYKQTA